MIDIISAVAIKLLFQIIEHAVLLCVVVRLHVFFLFAETKFKECDVFNARLFALQLIVCCWTDANCFCDVIILMTRTHHTTCRAWKRIVNEAFARGKVSFLCTLCTFAIFSLLFATRYQRIHNTQSRVPCRRHFSTAISSNALQPTPAPHNHANRCRRRLRRTHAKKQSTLTSLRRRTA